MIEFLNSTVGKKFLMGVSAAIWAIFVLGHMAGNLIIFLGPDAYNTYGHFASAPPLIYVVESILIIAFIVHVWAALTLSLQNRKAKEITYAVQPEGAKAVSLASRTMLAQGLLILFFLVFHLMTFKFGPYYETTVDGVVMRDLARLIYEVFHNLSYVLGYIFCLLVLGFHLSHGFGSIFVSLGLPREAKQIKVTQKLSKAYAVIVIAGFIALPVYVYTIDFFS